MSIDATRWAWQQNLSPTRKLLLLALADRASERHDCYPSIIRLKADTGLYEKTIKEALQELEKLGLLAIERRPGESSVYRLIGVPDRHQKAVKNQTHEEGEKAPHQGGGKPPSPESEGGGKAPHCGVEKHPTGGVEKHPLNLSVEPTTEPKERERHAPMRAPTPTLPDWIDSDLWEAFKVHRQQIKKPMTEQAEQLNLRCLGKIRELGQDPNEVIETTIANGWTGLNWALDRATNRGKTNEPHQRIDNSAPARVKRAYAAKWAREDAVRASDDGSDAGAIIDLSPDDYGPTH